MVGLEKLYPQTKTVFFCGCSMKETSREWHHGRCEMSLRTARMDTGARVQCSNEEISEEMGKK